MIIAIPVCDNKSESEVCQSFGRAAYFLFYNTETKENIFIDNIAANSQGGAGIKAAQIIVDNDANILLTPRCGENAADVIKAANIKIYKTINESVLDNITALVDGKLSLLNDIHAGFHNHGEN